MSHTKIKTTGIVVDLLLVDDTTLPQGARHPELRVEGSFATVFLRFFKRSGEHFDIEFDNVYSTRELTNKAFIEISPPGEFSEYFAIAIYDDKYSSERVAKPDRVKDFLAVKTE